MDYWFLRHRVDADFKLSSVLLWQKKQAHTSMPQDRHDAHPGSFSIYVKLTGSSRL